MKAVLADPAALAVNPFLGVAVKAAPAVGVAEIAGPSAVLGDPAAPFLGVAVKAAPAVEVAVIAGSRTRERASERLVANRSFLAAKYILPAKKYLRAIAKSHARSSSLPLFKSHSKCSNFI